MSEMTWILTPPWKFGGRDAPPGSLRLLALLLAASAILAPAGAAATTSLQPAEAMTTLLSTAAADGELAAFYRARDFQPLWVTGSALRPEAARVVELIAHAAEDGLDPAAYGGAELAAAVEQAGSGSPAALVRAEILLSRSFGAYARDLRRPADIGAEYIDGELAPQPRSVLAILIAASTAPSLASAIDDAVRMNLLYTRLRSASAAYRAQHGATPAQEAQFRANLERFRALPVELGRRFVVVDAATARLWMYEDGEVQGTMRVVVGRPSDPTPFMAGFIRYLALNPYWNVPPDLVRRLIAPQVTRQGVGYLRAARYEILSDWSDAPRVLDPRTVDWAAVAAGQVELAVRQTPGPRNSMGSMKFMFPNRSGVYLHDTPNRALFLQDDRHQSSGCVRVEDAVRLARWLFGSPVHAPSDAPELSVNLPAPVPIYLVYLTATPEDGGIAFHPDVYGRDRQHLTQFGGRIADGAR